MIRPVSGSSSDPSNRLVSLDQFRGFTVLAMLVVNFAGNYGNVPRWLGREYADFPLHDAVMPQFFLAVGFALRLMFVRRVESKGAAAAYRHAFWRGLGLVFLGIVFYHLTGRYDSWDKLRQSWIDGGAGAFVLAAIKRKPFEALTHIGVTTLFVIPVIGAPGWVRAGYALMAGAIHASVSLAGYYAWNLSDPPGVDGGPLGFLTWSIPVIAGTLACDWVIEQPSGGTGRLVTLAAALMTVGYALSCRHSVAPLPLVELSTGDRDCWTMSQRAGSVSCQSFGAGLALIVYAAFRSLCDHGNFTWRYFGLLGRNALAAYLIHGLVGDLIHPFTPRDAPMWYVAAAFAVYLSIITVLMRYLDRRELFLRL